MLDPHSQDAHLVLEVVDPPTDELRAYSPSPPCREALRTGDVIAYALERPSLRYGVVGLPLVRRGRAEDGAGARQPARSQVRTQPELMPPAPTGHIIRRPSGAWALRFRAYGQRRYVTLGTSSEGWTRRTAHTELQNILADVRRGIWCPVEPEPARPRQIDRVFGEFATKWFEASRYEWQPNTACGYEWQLRRHLLPVLREPSPVPDHDRRGGPLSGGEGPTSPPGALRHWRAGASASARRRTLDAAT